MEKERPFVATRSDIAAFLRNHYSYLPGETSDDVAEQFAGTAAFEALRLAGLVAGPDGQLIENGVKLVYPPAYPAFRVVVDGMKLAAAANQRGYRKSGLVIVGLSLTFATLATWGTK